MCYEKASGSYLGDVFTNISDMKSFLKKQGADLEGIVEKEDLRRLLWETQVYELTPQELTTFMTTNSITFERTWCLSRKRDAAANGFKAKQPTQPDSPSLTSSSSNSSSTSTSRPLDAFVVPIFQEGEVVLLTGLKKDEMNGKSATIVNGSPDADGRIRVKIEHGTGFKEFRVKPEKF